jgi:hypothetical protein
MDLPSLRTVGLALLMVTTVPCALANPLVANGMAVERLSPPDCQIWAVGTVHVSQFGVTPGRVTIDGVPTSVYSWTDTGISAPPAHGLSAGNGPQFARGPKRFAGFVDSSVVTSMTPGQFYPVTMSLRNTGDTPWRLNDGYRLVPSSPTVAAAWGNISISLPSTVLPEDEVVFAFFVLAPSTAASIR